MSRLWCFTKQSSGFEDDLTWSTLDTFPLVNPDESIIQCLYYQVEEAPTTKKIHLQGFIIAKRRIRFNTLQKLFPGVHIVKARGTQQQNIDYCSKSTSRIKGPYKIGEFLKPGECKALSYVCEGIKQHKPFTWAIDEYPEIYIRNYNGLMRYRELILDEIPIFRQLEVHWYYGKTGTGKTRSVYEQEPNVYRCTRDAQWWDGYFDQKAILFDEFYGDIRCKDMLNYLDGYRIQLPVKGGFVNARWTVVYITSNISPESVYMFVLPDVKDAFMRRINNIKYFE